MNKVRTRQDHSAGGDNHVVADLSTFLNDGALAHKHTVADGGRGDERTVANGHLHKHKMLIW